MDPKKAPPKTRPAFYLFICPDSFLCQAKLKQMLAATPLKSGAWQKRIYWGDEEPTASFFEQFNSGSLLGESTCLLVYNCQAWSAATFKKLETAFRNLAPSCWPFLAFQGAWKAGEPKILASITKLKFFVTAQKKGWIWQHPGLSEENLKGYIYQRSRELNLNLPPAALESIALSCPCEAGAVEQELNKLALFYEAKGNLAELENQNVRGGEFNVFELIPCLERGDLASVYKHLQGQRDLEKIFFTLLVVLEREYRLLWQLKQGLSKVCSPWEAQKKRGRAQALPNYVLAKAQALIVTAEFRVKQGLADPKDALNAFLIELSELFLSYQKGTPRRRLN